MEVLPMTQITCVECAGSVDVDADLMQGEILQCPDCGVELEVLTLNPLTVELAPEVEEDWGE
jgi:alpha-aminoadipate carrier protein LysW